jgi:hypothetical protein
MSFDPRDIEDSWHQIREVCEKAIAAAAYLDEVNPALTSFEKLQRAVRELDQSSPVLPKLDSPPLPAEFPTDVKAPQDRDAMLREALARLEQTASRLAQLKKELEHEAANSVKDLKTIELLIKGTNRPAGEANGSTAE